METVQKEHTTNVAFKTERALKVVQDMGYSLNLRMAGIEREQSAIKGSNERIIGYLKVLIEERGIDLIPDMDEQ